MLVLSRKQNQSVIVNDSITVLVSYIRGDRVGIGIDAPADVPVHRHEVWLLEQERRQHAAESVSARLNTVKMFDRSDWTVDELLTTTDPMLRSAVDAEVRAMRRAG